MIGPQTDLFCRQPNVGDVVIFHPDFAVRSGPSWFNDDVFIKRIVAVAGDTVEVEALSPAAK